MDNASLGIGIFDSGVGGVTVLKELINLLPRENFYYLGDTAHVPYGSKSKEELLVLGEAIIRFFLKLGVKMVVFACNTSSALTLPILKEKYPVLMEGMIEPLRKNLSSIAKVGVLATKATVESGLYEKKLLESNKFQKVQMMACPLYVPLIEKGIITGPEVEAATREYLEPLIADGLFDIILGCTHYPFLGKTINKLYPKVRLIDPAAYVAQEVYLKLKENKLLGKNEGKVEFFVTGDGESIKKLGSLYLGSTIDTVKKIDLGVMV
ncbi:glutamate racemase [Carboxydothermus pertinax]|uniref:Glutamate racemase n=1 Tax=Carboxydothermus pertinax TaxID=870242 RepID=A0A1L8CRU5_9THEO|nr:glutamate racemase [Carboxydothermus pertinax]GAV21642.1 glutamate racemase [Carboxydothermus pertinax]